MMVQMSDTGSPNGYSPKGYSPNWYSPSVNSPLGSPNRGGPVELDAWSFSRFKEQRRV